jgi:hypothetical protein
MDNREENRAQAQSDAPPDAVAEVPEEPERADGRGSDANGITEFDEIEGERRKQLYKKTGSPIVSRID